MTVRFFYINTSFIVKISVTIFQILENFIFFFLNNYFISHYLFALLNTTLAIMKERVIYVMRGQQSPKRQEVNTKDENVLNRYFYIYTVGT